MKNYTICDECGEYGKVEEHYPEEGIVYAWHCENCGCGETQFE